MRCKDAEIDLLRAQLAQRDAELDLPMLQWAHSNQCLAKTAEIAQESLKLAKSAQNLV